MRFFIGPMSKNVVDAVINFNSDIGLIPSRRQVDYGGGYVRYFISWATNTSVFDDKDLDRTIEEWEKIRIIMDKKMKLSNKTSWYQNELVDIFEEVVNNVAV